VIPAPITVPAMGEKHRFPWHIFHPKNLQSPARRLADVCRYWALKSPCVLTSTGKEQTKEFCILLLVCARDIAMARISLKSMLTHCSRIPKLIVAHDQSLTSQEAVAFFADWSGDIEFFSQSETAEILEKCGETALATFCRRHIFGYKLAACVRSSINHRTLYSDADVLWFGDCNALMAKYSHACVLGSADLGPAVDDAVVKMFDPAISQLVLQQPRVCAGFAIYNVSMLQNSMIKEITGKIVLESEIGRLAEQTVVGALARTEGGVISLDDVQMIAPNHARFVDSFRGLPRFARHYPDIVRTQFWLDAGLAVK
jgi:hypothetical protein